jgi:hypothetical protein
MKAFSKCFLPNNKYFNITSKRIEVILNILEDSSMYNNFFERVDKYVKGTYKKTIESALLDEFILYEAQAYINSVENNTYKITYLHISYLL